MSLSTRRLVGGRVTYQSQHARAALEAVHHHLLQWFDRFATSSSPEERMALAAQICAALRGAQRYAGQLGYPSLLQSGLYGHFERGPVAELIGARELLEQIESWPSSALGLAVRVELLGRMFSKYLSAAWWEPNLMGIRAAAAPQLRI